MEGRDEWAVAHPASHWRGLSDPSLAVSRRIVALPTRIKRFVTVILCTLVASFVLWEVTLPYCDAGMEDLSRPSSDFCRACPFRGHCLQGKFLQCSPGYALSADRCVPEQNEEEVRLREVAFNQGVTEILTTDMCQSDFSWGPGRSMVSQDRLSELLNQHPNKEAMLSGVKGGLQEALSVLHEEADSSRGRPWYFSSLVRLEEVRINGAHKEITYEKAYSLRRLPFSAPFFCQVEHFSRSAFLMDGEAMWYLVTTCLAATFLAMVGSNMPKAREEHRQRERLVQRAQQLLTVCPEREINSHTLRDLVIVNPEDEASGESPPSDFVWSEVMQGVRSIIAEGEQ